MIDSVEGNVVTNTCYNCGQQNTIDLDGVVVGWSEGFNEWKPLAIPCDCGNKEILNMDDIDVKSEEGSEKKKQRDFVEEIILLVREDHVGGGG